MDDVGEAMQYDAIDNKETILNENGVVKQKPPTTPVPNGGTIEVNNNNGSNRDSVISTDGNGENNENNRDNTLHAAVKQMDVAAVHKLLETGVNVNYVNKKFQNAVHVMVAKYLRMSVVRQAENFRKFEEIYGMLLHYGIYIGDTDIQNRTPLHYVASHMGQDNLLQLLVSSGIDVNAVDQLSMTALHIAVSQSDFDTVRQFIESGANVNAKMTNGLTPLHFAARAKNGAAVISLLCRCGADPDSQTRGGSTPLHEAAKAGRPANIEELLAKGAKIYRLDSSGQSPLHLAAAHDMTGKGLACLLGDSKPRDLNRQDTIHGETPLHKAVRLHMFDCIKVLLKSRIDPNIPDHQGNTALHHATQCHEVFVWQGLLRIKADINAFNNAGISPIMILRKCRNRIAESVLAQLSEQ